MSRTDDERLRRLLGGPDSDRLVRLLRRRVARAGGAVGFVTMSAPTEGERRQVAGLLGRRAGDGERLRVDVAELERVVVRAGAAGDLRTALEALGGPLDDPAATRAAEQAEYEAALARLAEAVAATPALAGLPDDLRRSGLPRRLTASPSAAVTLLERLAAVLARLPADPPLPRSVLGARAVGDSHALDDGRPLATLSLRAAALLASHPVPASASERQRLWQAAGVVVGGVTDPVLCLGFPGDATSVTGRALALWHEAGEPAHLTLRQLTAAPPDLRAMTERAVFVCENTSVVAAAADALGRDCAPLVCIASHPSSAAGTLLAQLDVAGARLRYHGDFDWGGLRIANGVMRRFGAQPWRFGVDDYRLASAATLAPLSGRPTTATWDRALAPLMHERGVRVEEEQVLDDLLADLAGGVLETR